MIFQSCKMAFKSILSNKMRSFLTMLGIIIGVMSLVVLVSLASGATESVTDSIDELGSNTLYVSISDDKGKPIRYDELDEFIESDQLKMAAPYATSSSKISGSKDEKTGTIIGTTAAYTEIQNLTLASGRFIKSPDVYNHTNVVVINEDLAKAVIGRTDVVGETISLGGTSYQIIGVLESSTSTSTDEEAYYEAYIPYTSLIRLTDSVGVDVTDFYVAATDENNMDQAEIVLENKLKERFNNDEDAYFIMNQSSIAEAMASVTNTLALLLGGIAGISLLVGGIGIMNIMLVSVTERTREIGIRKAIGAGYWSIMLQFLIEALVVSLLGCLIGIALSAVAIQIIDRVGSVSYGLSTGVIWVSVAFSLLIGVIFGIYPANKAARKKPIDALRYTG